MNYLYKNLSVEALEKRIKQMDIYINEERNRLFTFFSANVLNFIPNSDPKEHIEAFKQVCLHQHLSWRDLDDGRYDRQLVIRIENAFIDGLKYRPGIVCTYHSGSYRLINKVLAEADVPFALVVNKTVLQQESDSFQKQFDRAAPGFPQSLNLIDAEEPTALFKMIRTLKSGKNLVVYVDGNTGSSENSENNVPVNFMEGKLSVRKGIAVLAELVKCPIYPVVCRRSSLGEIHFEVPDAIFPSLISQGDASHIQQTMQRLYRNLEKVLEKDPFQWECWLYLHQYMVLPERSDRPVSVGMKELMDARLWGLFKIDGHSFALHKESYSSFRIPLPIYDGIMGGKSET